MPFPASFHEAIKEVMLCAAETAILPRLGTLHAADKVEKSVNELVTIADRESEQILAAGLQRILPEARIVGEEAADADPTVLNDLGGELCWIIDPLDGTNNFASGHGPFGIMIALAERGRPVAGWIFDPLSARYCHAVDGGGAWVGGERLQSLPDAAERQRLSISSLFGNDAARSRISQQLGDRYEIVPMPRCAAAQYPAIALGKCDVALFGRTLPWDHAAGVVLINECGGRAARLDGSEYLAHDRQPNMIVAACPRRWDQFATAFSDTAVLESRNAARAPDRRGS